MVARCRTPVARIPSNEKGRDFVVGDVHGCFDLVIAAMKKVGFDRTRDRILAVGDLIDRGPDSHRCVRFLSHDWVVAVRGNHEDMLLEIYQDGEPHPAVVEYMTSRNGFGWWNDADEDTRKAVLESAARMPIALEVETHRGTVGLVHADVPKGMDWRAFTAALEAGDEAVMQVALWGRDRLHGNDLSGVEGIGRVFVGHTPMARATRIGNVFAMDTGAVFGVVENEGFMSFADACSATNSFRTFGTMKAPDDLVSVLAEAREGRPFSNLLGA